MGMSRPDPQMGVIHFGNTENEVGVFKDINGGGDRHNDQDQVDDAIEEVTEVSDSVIVKLEFGERGNSSFLNGDGELKDSWKRVLGDIQRALSQVGVTENSDSKINKDLPETTFVNGGIELSGGTKKKLNSGATGLGQITPQNILKCTALTRPVRGCMIICKRGEQHVLSRRCPRT